MVLEVIPGKPLDYFWEDHGLRLHIPADALDASTPTLTMKIQASLSGQFKLPDDMELVSGVYWISFPSEELKQPINQYIVAAPICRCYVVVCIQLYRGM